MDEGILTLSLQLYLYFTYSGLVIKYVSMYVFIFTSMHEFQPVFSLSERGPVHGLHACVVFVLRRFLHEIYCIARFSFTLVG